MPIQLINKDHKKLYNHISKNLKSKNKKNEKYSIFGRNKAVMDFSYISVSDVERNNRGFYTESYREPSSYQEGLRRLNYQSINVPVWLLPFIDQTEIKDENQQIDPIVTQSQEDKNDPANKDEVEKLVQQLGITQRVESASTSYDKVFTWPYGGNQVILTGDFDNWQESIKMSPVISNDDKNIFTATVTNLDSTKDLQYKFVVDGTWCYDMNTETMNNAGNMNNIIHAMK